VISVGGLRARHGAASPDDVGEPSPLRDNRFRIFAAGNATNNVGEALYAVALPLLVFQQTGSLAVMALLAAAVPVGTLLAPVFGAVADRGRVRALVVYGLVIQAAAAAGMNVLLLTGRPSAAELFGCALLVAIAGVAYRVGWMTGIPSMFPSCPVRARGTLNSLFWATTLAGPILMAVALPWVGYVGLLWLNLPTFFAPLVVWAMGVRPSKTHGQDTPHPRGRRNWHEGARVIVADRRIRTMLVAQLVLEVACGTGLTSLIVYDLRDTWSLSAQQAGIVVATMSLGMLVGNLLVSQRRRMRPWFSLTAGMAVRTVSLMLLAVPVWPVFLAALALGTLGQGSAVGVAVMMRMRYLPAHVLGRASGLMWLLTGSAALLSPVVTLALDNAIGAGPTFLVLGLSASTVLWYLKRARTAWASVDPANSEPDQEGQTHVSTTSRPQG
jgi:MFS family permease